MSMPLTLPQLFDRFPDDAAAERWPDGVRCPSCDADDVQARPTRKPQPYRCRVCRRDFSVKTATVMHGSNLDCRVWVIALYLLTSRPKGVSSRQLHGIWAFPTRPPGTCRTASARPTARTRCCAGGRPRWRRSSAG